MQIKNQLLPTRKALYGILLLALFLSVFGSRGLSSASAQEATVITTGYVLSDGQFVYGPNVGDFNLKTYFDANAPHLLDYADDLYGRSEYFSINPKIYLTLLEIHSHLISVPEPALMEDPFGLNNGDFIAQIETLSNKMAEAYYLHIYSYSALPVSQRNLEPFVTPSGVTINVASDTNAGTYAVIAGLAAMDEQNISLILDNSQVNGFYQTYTRLFGNDDPLDQANHINIPGGIGALAAPDNLLQLPYLRGLSWYFGGVHNTNGTPTFTDASSLDFYPWPIAWGGDTSNMWVVAAASGIPTRYSDCGFKVSHSGAVNVGWETTYYHLEGAKYLSGSINQNDKIGMIANTFAEATCTGGAASGPHVHFSLKYNGAYFAINGTPLSGWYVHSGRYSYDVDPNYMWLERAGEKKYPNNSLLLSEGPQVMSVSNAGTGSGTVTSIPSGINCGLDCTETYFSNTTVTLTAMPTAGSFFAGWSGACTGTGSCVVTMAEARSVAAIFTLYLFGPISMWTTNFNYSQEGWRVEKHPRMLADVNGDGNADVVGFGYAGVWVALSDGVDGFAPITMWTTNFNYSIEGWRVEKHPRMLADVNGDNCADVVGFGYEGVWVALSDCIDGFAPMSMWTTNFNYSIEGWRVEMHPRMLADVNGDGCADVVGFGYNGVWVGLSNSCGASPSPSFAPITMWTDNFNYSIEGWRIEKHPRIVADVNGDGNADVVGFGYAGVWVALSDGIDGFAPISMWTDNFNYSIEGWRVEKHPRMLADVNHDKKADLIGFGYNGVWAALAR